MELGFIDKAIASLTQCLAIDSGYLNCHQHLAYAYLLNGEVETALKLNNETLEHLFHSTDDGFVSTYVRTGHRHLALHIASAKLESAQAPLIEWIRAIENPNADNSAGFARLKDWERQSDSEIKLYFAPSIFLSFRAYEYLDKDTEWTSYVFWHPDGDEFRATAQFKKVVRELGVFEYWQARGFPPQCKPVGADDFECGRP